MNKGRIRKVSNLLTFTSAVVLILPIRDLRAQELQLVSNINSATASSQRSQGDDSSSLKTSPASLQNRGLESIETPTNTLPRQEFRLAQSGNYSWTNFNVDELTDKSVVEDSARSLMIAQQILVSDLILHLRPTQIQLIQSFQYVFTLDQISFTETTVKECLKILISKVMNLEHYMDYRQI
jgi:hypothetical protein